MRPSNRSSDARTDDETGAAAIEFILVGIVLLVPIVYLIVVLGTVQQHALGTESAARHIARAVSTAPDLAQADARVSAIADAVAVEYGMSDIVVDLECLTPAATCPEAGATVAVRVSTEAVLPFVPPLWGLDRFARIPVEATAVHKVSRYRAGP